MISKPPALATKSCSPKKISWGEERVAIHALQRHLHEVSLPRERRSRLSPKPFFVWERVIQLAHQSYDRFEIIRGGHALSRSL